MGKEAPFAAKVDHFVEFGNIDLKDYADDSDSAEEDSDKLSCNSEESDNESQDNVAFAKVNDPYYWLRSDKRDDENVLNYLKAENQYYTDYMENLNGVSEHFYRKMLANLKETDQQFPYPDGKEYIYYSRNVEGLSYRINCRKKRITETSKLWNPCADDLSGEEVVLDENVVSKGHEYADISGCEPSLDHSKLGYAVDYTGNESYTIKFVSLTDFSVEFFDRHFPDELVGTSGDFEWNLDGTKVFYTTLDEEMRPFKVFIHVMGTKQSEDVCLFTENNAMFWVGIGVSSSEDMLIISTDSKETSESYIVPLNVFSKQIVAEVDVPLLCVRKREKNIRYSVDHWTSKGDDLYQYKELLLIVTNLGGREEENVMCCELNYSNTREIIGCTEWRDLVIYDERVRIESIGCFKSYLMIFGREFGMTAIWIASMNDISSKLLQNTVGKLSSEPWRKLHFNEDSYEVEDYANSIYDATVVSLTYTSLTLPVSIILYDMVHDTYEVVFTKTVPNYDASLYETLRLDALSRDGVTQIPISLVYRKAEVSYEMSGMTLSFSGWERENKRLKCIASRPLLLYGYGSYGCSTEPSFDFKRVALLDCGVVFAIAHIRGGGELGRRWYDDGKYLRKMNTFYDFIDCANYLVDNDYTSRDKLAIVGRSAGGLLVGSTITIEPNLCKAAVADVPFVDALITMGDPDIPLTVTEWEEWGNPHVPEYFDYMKSYSPYNNIFAPENDHVKAKNIRSYPSLLVTTGLHDPRVAYWEGAKFVARVREFYRNNPDSENIVLLKTDMSSGHFSATDRYKFLKEMAAEYAFIFEQICKSLRSLPVDKETKVYPRSVKNAIFSMVKPTSVVNPKLVAYSLSALQLLGFDHNKIELEDEHDIANFLSGNVLPNSVTSYAHCYCGHQFGNFAGQLGDGAAISLGEIVKQSPLSGAYVNSRWELQLKGSGKTPYSREADGRKVLRSSIREFLASEGMHFLGIPTVRCATCVVSDSEVTRDPYYDGNAIKEKCAIVSRVAPNFFRFGSFEIFRSLPISDGDNFESYRESTTGPSAGNFELKRKLLDHLVLYYLEERGERSNSAVDHFNLEQFLVELMNECNAFTPDKTSSASGMSNGQRNHSGKPPRKPDNESRKLKRGHDCFASDSLNQTTNTKLIQLLPFVEGWPSLLAKNFFAAVEELYGMRSSYGSSKSHTNGCDGGSVRDHGESQVHMYSVAQIEDSIMYLIMYCELTYRTIRLVADWQSVGFTHGVLNTDNMSMMGLTIDYGPYAYMEYFDPMFISNGSDSSARYCYKNQPEICKWNLLRLSDALSGNSENSLLWEAEIAETLFLLLPSGISRSIIDNCYDQIFQDIHREKFMKKLGIISDQSLQYQSLLDEMFDCLTSSKTDFTDFFVALTEFVEEIISHNVELRVSGQQTSLKVESSFVDNLIHKIGTRCPSISENIQGLQRCLRIRKLSMPPQQIMKLYSILQSGGKAQLRAVFNNQPSYVIDSFAEEIKSQKEILDTLISLSEELEILTEEKESKENICASPVFAHEKNWRSWIDKYISVILETWRDESFCIVKEKIISSAKVMRASNPTFILRKWVLFQVIEAAEKGDYSEVRTVMKMLENPFNPAYSVFNRPGVDTNSLSPEEMKYIAFPPDWSHGLFCTCSS